MRRRKEKKEEFPRKEEERGHSLARRAPTARSRPFPLTLKEISLSLLFVVFLSFPVFAKSFLTQEEALRLAFPKGAVVTRKTAFLSDADRAEVARRSGGAPPPGLVAFYAATLDGKDAGTAYFDTHVVRTLPETILVAVDPKGAITRVEVLSFSEPEEYLPRGTWYGQFPGKTLGDELSEKRGLRTVTGATITVRVTVEAARRVLALDAFLKEKSRR
ncbi:MAG TPA: FMN-binding protein [Thermoanaerobaculia bacterium]|nr:FMN-binding protein [Thermoanaerobaculia bacterium]